MILIAGGPTENVTFVYDLDLKTNRSKKNLRRGQESNPLSPK